MLLLFLGKTPTYLRMLFYMATNHEISGEIGNGYYWKKEKKSIAKQIKLIFSGTVETNWSRQNSMTENVVHYLNMKMPDISVSIIDLQLCSSLKWDGV